VPTFHRSISGEYVFKHARLDMVGAGAAICGGRAFVEDPRLVTFGLAQ